MDVCKVVIDDLRNMKEDSYWIKIYEEIQLLCQKLSLNLTIPRIGSRRMITELFNDSDNPSDYYKIIFHTSLNNVINDLNVRFGKEQEYLPLLCRLIPIKCNELLDEEIQKLLVKYEIFLNCTKLELRK